MKSIRVRVGGPVYSEKSIGVLVDVILGPKPADYSASRLEWFPKSLCKIDTIEKENHIPEHYLTAPEWLLDKKNVSAEPKTLK